MKRRIIYLSAIIILFALVFGVPTIYKIYVAIPPECPPGTLRPEGMTDGPCPYLDGRYLSPYGVMWARSFKVREGSYNGVAYIQNPNDNAGVAEVNYRFRLFDDSNVLVADKEGRTFIMPGGITPVFVSSIPTGNREVVHTFFDFTSPLIWQIATDTTKYIVVTNKKIEDVGTAPRLSADAQNTTVVPIRNLSFVAVVFDPQGNAFASSATVVPFLGPNATTKVVFTWPQAFPIDVGRLDVIARVPPDILTQR